MQIDLKNIGMISEVSIELSGVTVIAGENDTGKSTISKLLYLLVKSINKSDNEPVLNESKKHRIKRQIDEIYFTTRANLVHDIEKNNVLHFRALLNRYIINQLFILLNSNLNEKDKRLKIDMLRKTLSDELLSRSNIEVNSDIEAYYDMIFSRIKEIVAEKISLEESFKYKFYRYLDSLFNNDLNNKFNSETGQILLKEGKTVIFRLGIENNIIKELFILDEIYFNDATFIESPMVLQMAETIYNSRTSLDFYEDSSLMYNKPLVDIHLKDLITKLRQPTNIEINNDSIFNIIDGNMDYDENENSFVFYKNKYRFKTTNVASGIKSFGILQMLLNKGLLNERSLLILDEPEVSMHPKWQVKYAELLVDIAKNNKTKILLTSHSPYFIEAIKVFSDNAAFKQNTNFYFSDKLNGDDSSVVYNVTEDLERVFEKLTEPFEYLEKESMRDLL